MTSPLTMKIFTIIGKVVKMSYLANPLEISKIEKSNFFCKFPENIKNSQIAKNTKDR